MIKKEVEIFYASIFVLFSIITGLVAYQSNQINETISIQQEELTMLKTEYRALEEKHRKLKSEYYETIDINNDIAFRYLELEDYVTNLYCLINYGNGESVSWHVRYGVPKLEPIGVSCLEVN